MHLDSNSSRHHFYELYHFVLHTLHVFHKFKFMLCKIPLVSLKSAAYIAVRTPIRRTAERNLQILCLKAQSAPQSPDQGTYALPQNPRIVWLKAWSAPRVEIWSTLIRIGRQRSLKFSTIHCISSNLATK